MSADAASPRWGRIALWAGAGLLGVLAIAVVVALVATSRPSFWLRYGGYQHAVSTLESSQHKGLACTQCHAEQGGALGYRAALVGDFYASMFAGQKPYTPTFVRFSAPTRSACLACHSHDWSMEPTTTAKVPHPAHLRTVSEQRDCVTCHRWTGHEETYQAQHTKMPFSTVCASFPCHSGWKQADTCSNCHHQLQQSLGTWKQVHPQVVRAAGSNGCLERCHTAAQCTECHTTGRTPAFTTIIETSTVTAIEKAHVKSDWLTVHGTFALADQSKCMTCHVTTQECQDCHSKRPAFHGTDNVAWIGTQHGPLAAKSDKRRCYTCHQKDECVSCHQQFDVKNVTL